MILRRIKLTKSVGSVPFTAQYLFCGIRTDEFELGNLRFLQVNPFPQVRVWCAFGSRFIVLYYSDLCTIICIITQCCPTQHARPKSQSAEALALGIPTINFEHSVSTIVAAGVLVLGGNFWIRYNT